MKTINKNKKVSRFDRDLLPSLRSVLSESLAYSLKSSWLRGDELRNCKFSTKQLQFFASTKTFDDLSKDASNIVKVIGDKIQWLHEARGANDKLNTVWFYQTKALDQLSDAIVDAVAHKGRTFNIADGLTGIFIKDYQAVLLVNTDKYGHTTWEFKFFTWSSKFDENILPQDNEVMYSDLLDPEELNSNLRDYFDQLRSDDQMLANMANDIDSNKKRFLYEIKTHPETWYFIESDVFGIIDIRKTVSSDATLVPTYLIDSRDARFEYSDLRNFLDRFILYDKFLRCVDAVYRFYKSMEGDPEFVYDYDSFLNALPGGEDNGME